MLGTSGLVDEYVEELTLECCNDRFVNFDLGEDFRRLEEVYVNEDLAEDYYAPLLRQLLSLKVQKENESTLFARAQVLPKTYLYSCFTHAIRTGNVRRTWVIFISVRIVHSSLTEGDGVS